MQRLYEKRKHFAASMRELWKHICKLRLMTSRPLNKVFSIQIHCVSHALIIPSLLKLLTGRGCGGATEVQAKNVLIFILAFCPSFYSHLNSFSMVSYIIHLHYFFLKPLLIPSECYHSIPLCTFPLLLLNPWLTGFCSVISPIQPLFFI